ncbi:MAG: D-alanine--D-alanine ligase [Microbacteriaceae bacterium]|jgi:D-alanine-D-alanine ligase|nr:D-alanine--D-alanine ligase [Microbacteriaceae bacterium]
MTDSTPRTIVVLSGGLSHERDVSLRSGRRVSDSLSQHGIEVVMRDPDASLLEYLDTTRPDVIWPALHGASGEDGALRGLLELLDLPFVGSGADASRLAWDKPTAKVVVGLAGVPTPRSITLPRDTFRELGAGSVLDIISADLPVPVVVKPAQGGSAQGVNIVDSTNDLPRAMVNAYTYSDVALIEQKIVGTEIAVSIIDTGDGPVALPAIEIEPISGVYTFEARYTAGETRYYAPARISDEDAARAATVAITAHKALGLRHISRIDLIVDGAGTPWFLEASTMPGLTETSLFPLALEAAGHDVGWVYSALAEAAVREARA